MGRVVFVDGFLVVVTVVGFAGLTIFRLFNFEDVGADDEVDGTLDVIGDTALTVLRTGQAIQGTIVLVNGGNADVLDYLDARQ